MPVLPCTLRIEVCPPLYAGIQMPVLPCTLRIEVCPPLYAGIQRPVLPCTLGIQVCPPLYAGIQRPVLPCTLGIQICPPLYAGIQRPVLPCTLEIQVCPPLYAEQFGSVLPCTATLCSDSLVVCTEKSGQGETSSTAPGPEATNQRREVRPRPVREVEGSRRQHVRFRDLAAGLRHEEGGRSPPCRVQHEALEERDLLHRQEGRAVEVAGTSVRRVRHR
jgi:hypothetical protein